MGYGDAFLAQLCFDKLPTTHQSKMFALMMQEATKMDTGLCDWSHPLAFTAKADANNNPNFYQALNGPNAEGFCSAMDTEIEKLLEKQTWDVVDWAVPINLGSNIVGTTWVFKRK